jgi:DNA-binding response OmpR family regulator
MRWSFNRGFLDGVNMAILARVEEIDRRVVSDRTIDSHVKKLRRKFAAAAPCEEWIHPLYGVGYKLEAPP